MASPPTRAQVIASWDEQIAKRKPDFNALYTAMKNASNSPEFQDDVELWWRLALVAMYQKADIDCSDEEARIAKVIEARGYAEKALTLSPSHFEANLWMASAVGEWILMQTDLQAKLQQLKLFYKHLSNCMRTHSDHWRVLLMEANLHMYLWFSDPEAEAAIRNNPQMLPSGLTRLELPAIEGKIRRALESKPDFFMIYCALFMVLIQQGRFSEAVTVGRQGLAIERTVHEETHFAQELERWLQQAEEMARG